MKNSKTAFTIAAKSVRIASFVKEHIRRGRLAQLGERSLDVRKVAGSIPVPSIGNVSRALWSGSIYNLFWR